MRCAIGGISALPAGYRLETVSILLQKVSKVSERFSSFRSFCSTQLHTFSCGLRSGEYFGQPGKTCTPNSASAAFAKSVWRRGSPSIRMWMEARALAQLHTAPLQRLCTSPKCRDSEGQF